MHDGLEIYKYHSTEFDVKCFWMESALGSAMGFPIYDYFNNLNDVILVICMPTSAQFHYFLF